MENASKALIIMGSVLIAILLVTLFLFAWGKISEYQSSIASLSEIENTSKFNSTFTAYDRDDVSGYELLSLLNQIIDYNERKTVDTKNGNEESFKHIQINVLMEENTSSEINRKKLTYDDTIRLFNKQEYEESELTLYNKSTSSRPSFKKGIEETIQRAIISVGGNEKNAQKVAKNIGSIFITESDIEEKANRLYKGDKNYVYSEMAQNYNNCTGENVDANYAKDNFVVDKNASNNKLYIYACMCYEYMQFKRGIFKCTNLTYDEVSGRVNTIKFEFTGKFH